jgi:hypothetical protein
MRKVLYTLAPLLGIAQAQAAVLWSASAFLR